MSPLICIIAIAAMAVASPDGAADNQPENVRPIPPPGIEVPAADLAEIQADVEQRGRTIESLREWLNAKPMLLDFLPDVQIYYNAVRVALKYNEIFDPKEIAVARALVKQGLERASELSYGHAAWNSETGLVVRGYVSKIDGS